MWVLHEATVDWSRKIRENYKWFQDKPGAILFFIERFVVRAVHAKCVHFPSCYDA